MSPISQHRDVIFTTDFPNTQKRPISERSPSEKENGDLTYNVESKILNSYKGEWQLLEPEVGKWGDVSQRVYLPLTRVSSRDVRYSMVIAKRSEVFSSQES